MTQELGPLARTLSLPYYEDALPAHDQFHAKRVRDIALRLASDCDDSVNRDIIAASAWLHDIGRPRERAGDVDDHDEWATAEAAQLLAAEGVEPDRISRIKHCIRTHSIRASSPEPRTLEAKFLFDADKLDAAGARGLVRLACIVGERSGRTGEKYAVIDDTSATDLGTSDSPDIELLRNWAEERLDTLYTQPGRRLGRTRREFMDEFFTQFAGEIGVTGEL
ncbi:HD domain-containing protein [Haloarcula argentinensis]|uniref:HD domain-containing protein n=1 Tax=Haloarcula argentinensis TaxID=43776 RepID=A0A830F8L4_HALAR|nr:HD domain-containing protein [Haloarcula argentinensis]EMA24255.1 metal-dependent phosphohydrolase [Haloarcula argentinensis DSM 12282]MDS0253631.1 HD domain-containing protein [Haloarcula argentinensis]GGM23007.1 phosphohydrolase [Haloarcula argentinensis]